MVTILKKGTKKDRIKKLLEKLLLEKKSKGIDAYYYLGKIKLNKDAMSIQKELRNEWE